MKFRPLPQTHSPRAARPHAASAWILGALLLLASGGFALAQETNAAPRDPFDAFRLIAERNIFNPNRSPRSARPPRRDQERPEPPARTETFSLVGIMSYEKGNFAFFDSASSDYRKVLEPDDTIAGYKLTEVAANHVKLAATNGQALELRVGMRMKRQGEEEWEVIRPSEPAARATSTASGGTSDSAASDDDSEIIKKLMQQREQELQK